MAGPLMAVLDVLGVNVHIEGDGAETIVMVPGWTDTYRLWDRQVEALKDRYRCVRFTPPGFDKQKPRKAYTLDEHIAFMDAVIARVSPGKQVIFLLHDWGCIFGYQYYLRNRGKVAKIIGVDVGDPSSMLRALTAREKLIAFWYQTWNAFAWKIGGVIGDRMMHAMAHWGRAPSDPAQITSHGLSVLDALVRRPRFVQPARQALRARIPDALHLRLPQAAALSLACVGREARRQTWQRGRRIRHRPLGDVAATGALQRGRQEVAH